MVSGSYTVEAALIFPMIFFVVIALIYMAFYLHDCIRIQGVLDKNIIRGGQFIKNERDLANSRIDYDKKLERGVFYMMSDSIEEKEKILTEYIVDIVNKGLYIANVKEINLEATNNKLEIRGRIEFQTPLKFVEKYFLLSGILRRVQVKERIYYPAELVRGYSSVGEVIDDIEGIEVIKKKLGELLSMFH